MSLEVSVSQNCIILRPVADGVIKSLAFDLEDNKAMLGDHGGRVILDFADIRHIGSAVLRDIVLLHRQARADGGKLTIAGARDSVKEIFRITGLNQLIDFHASIDESVAAHSAA